MARLTMFREFGPVDITPALPSGILAPFQPRITVYLFYGHA